MSTFEDGEIIKLLTMLDTGIGEVRRRVFDLEQRISPLADGMHLCQGCHTNAVPNSQGKCDHCRYFNYEPTKDSLK